MAMEKTAREMTDKKHQATEPSLKASADRGYHFYPRHETAQLRHVLRILLGLGVLMHMAPLGLAGDLEVHGFALGAFSGRVPSGPRGGLQGQAFLVAEERLRLDMAAWADSIQVSARMKIDLLHDAVEKELDVALREAYLDYSAGDFDFRLGRQIITWGVGDLLFVNDVFPKDWVSFFSGRPLEYLKLGVDGFRMRYSSQAANVELVITPFFQPDRLPAAPRFVLPSNPVAPVSLGQDHGSKTTAANTEVAFRVYRRIGDFDLSVYAYRGLWRIPSTALDDLAESTRVTTFYPRLAVYGLSAQGSTLGGVVSLETGYYDSSQDGNGRHATLPNSQARFLAGYQRQIGKDFTFGLQYYGEIMQHRRAYQASLFEGFPAQKRLRDMVTVRLEHLLRYQTWKVSCMTFYSPADRDYFLQPQFSYKFSDQLSGSVGANVFGGREKAAVFGRLRENNNIFLSVRFDF